MRIAFVVNNWPSVSETFILDQITGLLDLSHEVNIFALGRPGRAFENKEIDQYDLANRTTYARDVRPTRRVVRWMKGALRVGRFNHGGSVNVTRSIDPPGTDQRRLAQRLEEAATKFLGNGYFDVVHTHFGMYGLVGVRLKDAGIARIHVTSFHGVDLRLGLQSNTPGTYYSKLACRGDLFITHSRYGANALNTLGFDARKVRIHPNGINVSDFTNPKRLVAQSSGHTRTQFRIITVARLEPVKRIDVALRALASVVHQMPEVEFEYTIVGDGSLRSKLQQLARDFGLQCVTFQGAMTRSDAIELVSASDAFVLSSDAEGLPTVLIEAMAAGLPIVATDVGGVSEIVKDGEDGYLVPTNDPERLATAISTLYRNHNQLQRNVNQKRPSIFHTYGNRTLTNKLVRMYEETLTTARGLESNREIGHGNVLKTARTDE